jgi:hypothetical protein
MTTTTIITHGLAADIRACTESETFDLGGVANIEAVVEQAFGGAAFVLPPPEQMIRITLVVGAGKQARQKYDPQATRRVTSTLKQALGFAEDRGASCVPECAGMYKLQHDTGKNLKTVVVFPRVEVGGGGGSGNGNGTDEYDDDRDSSGLSNSSSSFFPPKSLEYKVAVCSMSVFETMVLSKFTSWLEKRALQQMIEETIAAEIQTCDDMLVRGTQLSAAQQEFYNACAEISSKQAHLKQAMHQMVDQSELTRHELEVLIEQVQQRIADLNGQSKPVPKQLLERRQKLQSMTTTTTDNNDDDDNTPKLKHHAALGKLWKQIQPVWHLQESGGALLSVHDAMLLGQKNDLLLEIERLEGASQGWLEDDELFRKRVDVCRRNFRQKFNIRGGGGGGGGSSSNNKNKNASSSSKKKNNTSKDAPSIGAGTKVRVPITKWVTPGQKMADKQAKKKNKMKKGDLFGAMMATYDDSDSDAGDDDDDSDDSEDENTSPVEAKPDETKEESSATTSSSQQQHQQQQSSSSSSSSPGKNKKKKNKKKKSKDKADDAVLNAAVAKNTALAKTKKEAEDETKSSALPIIILRDFVIPIVMALLTWILGMILGTSKKKKN